MKTLLRVEGMSCAHCVQHVKEALEALAGVSSAEVNLKKKTALVEHDETADTAAFRAAVTEAGYEAV